MGESLQPGPWDERVRWWNRNENDDAAWVKCENGSFFWYAASRPGLPEWTATNGIHCRRCLTEDEAKAEVDAYLAAMAGSVELKARVAELEARVAELDAENAALRAQVESLTAALHHADLEPRPDGCLCQTEAGDSPCAVHGEED